MAVPVVLAVGEAPGDREAHRGRLAGRHPEMGGDRAMAAAAGRFGRIPPVLQLASGREVTPEDLQITEPRGFGLEPVLLIAHPRGIGGQGHIAIGDVSRLEPIAGEPQHGQLPRAVHRVDVVLGERIPECAADRVGDRLPARVLHLDLKERRRYSRVLVVEGDEWVEGSESHPARELRLPKGDGGDGELAVELAVPEVGDPGQPVASGPEAEGAIGVARERSAVGRREVAVEHARVQHLPPRLGLDREVGEPIGAALVRPVEDLPVDEAAIAGEADRAGAYAPERKRDLPCVRACVAESVHAVLLTVRSARCAARSRREFRIALRGTLPRSQADPRCSAHTKRSAGCGRPKEVPTRHPSTAKELPTRHPLTTLGASHVFPPGQRPPRARTGLMSGKLLAVVLRRSSLPPHGAPPRCATALRRQSSADGWHRSGFGLE